MKLFKVFILAVFPADVNSFNPFRARGAVSPKHIGILEDPNQTLELSSEINLNELLDSRSRKPEIYTKAMVELKRLEEQPICHRMAAQLLLNNCRGLENVDEETFQWDSVHLQRHNVESFSASLSMCDMEKGKFKIPEACVPLSSPALYRAVRQNQGRLEISSEQVGDCLEAMAQDHSQWNTWLSNRDKALLFCRAARLDIDKDQAILLHKKLTEIMETFSNDLEHDMKILQHKFTQNTDAADKYFEKMMGNAEVWKSKIQSTFESVSEDANGASTTMKSILNSSNDAMRTMRAFLHSMVQGNAEMAAEQEQAMVISTGKFETRIGSINEMVGESETTVKLMKDTLEQLIPVVINLHERQDALDQRSQAVLSAVMNATELLQGHAQKLEQASFKASGINDDLEKAAATAKTWSETLGLGSSTQDVIIRVISPIASLFLGGYGLPATLARNVLLLFGGCASAETYILVRDWWERSNSRTSPRTPFQKDQELVSLTINATPISLETPSTSQSSTSLSVPPTELV